MEYLQVWKQRGPEMGAGWCEGTRAGKMDGRKLKQQGKQQGTAGGRQRGTYFRPPVCAPRFIPLRTVEGGSRCTLG